MSTPTSDESNVRITHEETVGSSGRAGSRRKQVVIVAAVAVVAMILIVFAFLWLRPAREVKTEAPAAAASTGTVKFLMEQQWLIHMKLAQAEEQTVARQITATGRVVPAANSQALVSPPVSGIRQKPAARWTACRPGSDDRYDSTNSHICRTGAGARCGGVRQSRERKA